NAGDVRRDRARPIRGLLRALRNFARCGRLLFNRCGERGGGVVDLADLIDDALRRLDGVVRRRADFSKSLGDFFREFLRLRGELFHLFCDDRETFAGFPGACGFDGGVQRQQIGLFGDLVDGFDDLIHAGHRLRQSIKLACALSGLLAGGAGCIGGRRHL
ncbi:unnamed protein product, partial [Chrysoparadoxa australica]